jgi:PAS domain S-box-containing protein
MKNRKSNSTTQPAPEIRLPLKVQAGAASPASQTDLQLVLEATPTAVVTVDQAGRIRFVNNKLEEMFGYSREELLGQEIESLLPERSRGVHIQYRQNYTDNPHIRSMGSGLDLAGRRKNGSEFPIEVGLSSLKLEQDL